MISFKSTAYSFMGNVYLPKEILESKEEKLLHISDTPAFIFPGIRRLIHKLKPSYLIHTGDLVDNLKLEIYPHLIDEYTKQVKQLIDIMESSNSKKIIITLGNHDNSTDVRKFSKNSIITEKDYTMDISGFSFNMSHYSKQLLDKPAQYNLFGHDLSIQTSKKRGNIYLNGITNINIITLKSMKIYSLPYPMGTNDARLLKSRFKL